MHFDIEPRTILLVNHGSHAYGLATPESDLDIKGVCIKPKACYFGFTQKFEQHEKMASKGGGVDSVVYSLDKFANLAADCNPSIIEVLWVDPSDYRKVSPAGYRLLEMREQFLSRKAKHTFSGYAFAQLGRIKTHRQWLLSPADKPPQRKDFGLNETDVVSRSELGAFQSMEDTGELMLPKQVVTLFVREREYQAALRHHKQYLNWKETRNPKRAELEAKYGYDCKHGSHLIRLYRMCLEILLTGKVIVKRPDREELLAIKSGGRSYDSLIEEADKLEAKCVAAYDTSPLPRDPDRAKLDREIIAITEEFLSDNG